MDWAALLSPSLLKEGCLFGSHCCQENANGTRFLRTLIGRCSRARIQACSQQGTGENNVPQYGFHCLDMQVYNKKRHFFYANSQGLSFGEPGEMSHFTRRQNTASLQVLQWDVALRMRSGKHELFSCFMSMWRSGGRIGTTTRETFYCSVLQDAFFFLDNMITNWADSENSLNLLLVSKLWGAEARTEQEIPPFKASMKLHKHSHSTLRAVQSPFAVFK